MRKVCIFVLSSIASLAVLFSVFLPFVVYADQPGYVQRNGDTWVYFFDQTSFPYSVYVPELERFYQVNANSAGQAYFSVSDLQDLQWNSLWYFPNGDAFDPYAGYGSLYPIDLSGLPSGVEVTVSFVMSGALAEISDWSWYPTIRLFDLGSASEFSVNDIDENGGIPTGASDCDIDISYNAVGTATVMTTTFMSAGNDKKSYMIKFLPYVGYSYTSIPLFTLSSLSFKFDSGGGGETSSGGGGETSGGSGGDVSPIVEALNAAIAGSPEQQAAIQERASEQEQKTEVFESYMQEMQVDPIDFSLPSVSLVEPEGGGDLIDFILSAPGFMLLLTTSCSCWVIGILLYGKRF